MYFDERHFIAAGLVLCLAAAAFGFASPTYTVNGYVPNVAAAGAAIGLGVAGGFSFLATALFRHRGGP